VEGNQPPTALDLVIAPIGEPAVRHAALVARDLRRGGYAVELVEGKVKRAMELADKLGARFALIIGETELASGRYAFKDMASGTQENLTQEEIAVRLAAAPAPVAK
jgi:histidyl-tRNA synthetase